MANKAVLGVEPRSRVTSKGHCHADQGHWPVSIRRFPYPFKAALSICSDIDDTETTADFLEIQRFLNTKEITKMGRGVGLEIGNSFYFYDDERHFSFFTHEDKAKHVIIDLIQAGYIDCLHTYGDAATERWQILKALDELVKEDCWIDIWINHNGSRSNLSRKFDYLLEKSPCLGDVEGTNAFHADVTMDYGIQFAWVGAITRLVGQSTASSKFPWFTVLDSRYPIRSSLSLSKEFRKYLLGKVGVERYRLHEQNELIRALELDTGHCVHEFLRYGNHPGSVGAGATATGLSYTISRRQLEYLKALGGFMEKRIGYWEQGASMAVNYFADSNGSSLVPNNTTLTLKTLAKLAAVTGNYDYLVRCPKLVNWLADVQLASGELPYSVGGTAQDEGQRHFLCYQYNAFQFLDLEEYFRLTSDQSIYGVIERLASFLAGAFSSSGAARYDCHSDSPEVPYYTVALSCALSKATDLGLGDFHELVCKGYRRFLSQRCSDGRPSFFSRINYGILTDRRAYPRNLAMILCHLLSELPDGGLVVGEAVSEMRDPTKVQ